MTNYCGTTFVLFINTLGSGGAQRQIVLLARELEMRGAEILLVHYGLSDFMAEMLRGSSVHIKNIRGATGLLGKFQVVVRMMSIIRTTKPACVVSFIDGPNLVIGLIRFALSGFVWLASERNTTVSETRFDVAWRRIIYRSAHAVLPNSSGQLAWLKTQLPREIAKIRLVPNGIDAAFFRSVDARDFRRRRRFVIFARISEQKDPRLLLAAIRLIPLEVRTLIEFNWFGETEPGSELLWEEMKRSIFNERLPLNVHQSTRRVGEVMDESDALILCSRFEGTPNVVLEAMARSLPVISSSVADLPIILGRGERGAIFSVGSPQGLAASILDFVGEEASVLRTRTLAANEYVQSTYSTEAMADSFISAFRESEACRL